MTINLDELEKLEKAADFAPWEWHKTVGGLVEITNHDKWIIEMHKDSGPSRFADAAFIVAIRNAAPELIRRVRELEVALRFYADPKNWKEELIDVGVTSLPVPLGTEANYDHGTIARHALLDK